MTKKSHKHAATLEKGTEIQARLLHIQKTKAICEAEDGSSIRFLVRIPPEARKVMLKNSQPSMLTLSVKKKISNAFYSATLKKKAPSAMTLEMRVKQENFLRTAFSSQLIDSLNGFLEKRSGAPSGHQDLRDMLFVTIDGADARDFDDAIFVRKMKSQWKLFVAIADVTYYVTTSKKKNEDSVDAEARKRGNSFYFPNSVIPMLPPILSNTLCSLKPFEDRLAIVCELTLSLTGTVKKSRFYEARINSHARLTYEEVQAAFFAGSSEQKEAFRARPHGEAIEAMLASAFELAGLLGKKRQKRGSLFFINQEPCYHFDKDKMPDAISVSHHYEASNLIEEFMIAANEACAVFLTERNVPFLYRIHPAPTEEALIPLFRCLAANFSDILPKAVRVQKRPLEPTDYPDILEHAATSEDRLVLSKILMRGMPKAVYAPVNTGHFGLASDFYCHFTSPIRRYADIVVHRALKYCLGHTETPLPTGKKLAFIGEKLNLQERKAQRCEWEIQRLLNASFMEKQRHKIYTAVINSITSFGVFVTLKELPVEGLIFMEHIATFADRIELQTQQILTKKGRIRYRIGSLLPVRVHQVNKHDGKISFVPVREEHP
ncbi:MAG: VacB/RNase II family 3'-5' exoribonuclease [Desulfovibrio sp.]|nr:VacB/RNase II family 3'-5' exoribonuclease [Desulfovibrio sp.]